MVVTSPKKGVAKRARQARASHCRGAGAWPKCTITTLVIAAVTLIAITMIVRVSQPRLEQLQAQLAPDAPLFNNTPYEVYSDTVVRKMVLEDLDNDGVEDLIAFRDVSTGGGLEIRRTSSHRGLRPTSIYATAYDTYDGEADNFDGNSDADVVSTSTNFVNSQFGFWSGNGDGTLDPPVTTDFPGTNIDTLVTLDADGDHDQDVIVVDIGNNQYRVGTNDGGASFIFAAPVAFLGPDITDAITANINGDSLTDFYVANGAIGSNVETLVSNGNGTFTSTATA